MEFLTNEQLCVLAQSGDEEAASRLIKINQRFIYQVIHEVIGSLPKERLFPIYGLEPDDLMQAGQIGLWKVIDGYDLSSGNKFLTYAAPAVKRAVIDLIRQYSQDKAWKSRVDQSSLLDSPSGSNSEESPTETSAATLNVKNPEQILIEQETIAELHEAMEALPDRENVYVQCRFGFTDGKTHPLTETAQYFHLTESRAKGVERSALKLLKHELLIEIPERAYARAEDKLTRLLVAERELHSVDLRLKSQQKRGRKITAAVYEYLADCDGKWGELRYNFKDDTAEVLLLADWDTTVSRRFAMRAVEYLRQHRAEAPPERLLLTFISPEQIECCGR
ncbi:MAG: sigma-70 family RNA polymerase sigma factor [Oscillospiraceae bacterium]|nr:sigma-70 family RNA polymerase sigma factor [Oscillospiraceae bacterium]